MKEKKYLVLSTVILIALLVFGVSYSFYKARIDGDTKSISLKTKGIYLLYKGDLNLVSGYIEPGWSVTKTFTIENQGSEIEKYNIYIKDLVNTFVTEGYLQYKITSSNGYNMSEYKDIPKAESKTDTVLAYGVTINPKEKQEYTIELIYKDTEEDQSDDMGKILSGTLNIQEGSYPDLIQHMLTDNPTIKERIDFSVTNTENTTGTIFQTNKTEDGSTVYYYSGNTTNNWVKFGKETSAKCTYNGEQVWHLSFDNNNNPNELKKIMSNEECISTNVCILSDWYGPVIGLTEEQCNAKIDTTWINETPVYSGMINEDMYWRIIRTNEDKSVRLLYSGTKPDTTYGYIGESLYNSSMEDPLYIGYMYGTSGSLENNRTNENSSIMKKFIDNWYEKNLFINYNKYVSKTAMYCNDRSISSDQSYSLSGFLSFATDTRLNKNKTPTYKCGGDGKGGLFESTQAIADKFSTSTESGGNGQLKYPIAMMTFDEFNFAGGTRDPMTSPYSWYYTNSLGNSITGSKYWALLSPHFYDGNSKQLNISGVYDSYRPGAYYSFFVNSSIYIRPTISLTSCVKIKSGHGTSDSPYEIDYEGSCN